MLKPQVVAVGGGHGLAATIRAVRRYAGRTTAVVATADDGGSTGRLRDAMALPAPGDVRHCLVAMAGNDPGADVAPLVDALEYRFDGTDVAGHALGNLLLAGLTAVTGDFVAAVDEASRLVGLDPDVARVLPATAEPVVLRATVAGVPGGELTGQVAISRAGGIERVAVQPGGARAPAAAVEALVDADQIVLGPGSLFTSVLAAAVVGELRQALADSRGRLVYVCNLRAEGTETFGYDVADHVAALRRHGIEPDVVVTHAGGLPLGDPGQPGAGTAIEVVRAEVALPGGLAHDSAKLAGVLSELVP
ncbi:MAG: gluconeogenesis factor YvcK family protein [Acidimicrobiales bacterium]